MSARQRAKDLIARTVAALVPPTVFRDARYFNLWQSKGYHITPVHFYEPIPDTRTLRDTIWSRTSEMVGVEMNEAAQLALLEQFAARFKAEYDDVPPMNIRSSPDWEVLYCMVRHFRPRQVIEIGSGVSTRVSALALGRNREEFGTESTLTAIDPEPRVEIEGLAGLTEIRPAPVQDVPVSEFQRLGENDVLFIDSSHVLKIGGDVQYEFLEIIPRLRPGVLVHVHDIFLPSEYRREWVMERSIFWNEAYLLQAFLAFNSAFETVLSTSYLSHRHPDAMRRAFSLYAPETRPPGSYWFRRRC
jgi:predicted O-methyltransferase YrrM